MIMSEFAKSLTAARNQLGESDLAYSLHGKMSPGVADRDEIPFVDRFGCVCIETGVQAFLQFVTHCICSQRDDGNTRTFCDQNSCYGVAVDFGHMDVTHNEIEGLREHEFAIKRAILSEHTDCNFAVLGEFDNGTCFSENMAYQSLIVRTIFHEQDT